MTAERTKAKVNKITFSVVCKSGLWEWEESIEDWPTIPVVGDLVMVRLEGCSCGEAHELHVKYRAFWLTGDDDELVEFAISLEPDVSSVVCDLKR